MKVNLFLYFYFHGNQRLSFDFDDTNSKSVIFMLLHSLYL